MQIFAINGSPRKTWNTGTILQKVLEGAAESRNDVLTETINLYDYHYRGCIECFECKRIGGPSYGKCAVKDDIHGLLLNLVQADAIVFGSPIYFSDMTGMLRCFMERLLFPNFEYNKAHSSLAPKKVRTAFIYTMNVPRNAMDEYHYPERLAAMHNFTGRVFGYEPKVQYVNDTYQFKDYSKYAASLFSEEAKKKQRETQFPVDCKEAAELGAALATQIASEI